MKVELRGAISAAGEFAQSAEAGSCSAFAAGFNNNHTFVIPSGVSTASVAGNPFALDATIVAYAGPGMYATRAFGDPTTTTLTVDQTSSQNPFEPVDAGASEAATVNLDGSGSFTFNDWQDAGLRSETGSVSWTCQDAHA